MLMLVVHSGHAGTNDTAAVGKSAVISLHLFLRNEMYGCIIVCKIVRHGLDLFFDFGKICALFGNNEALSRMLLSGGQFRIFAASDRIECLRYRNGILSGILYALNPANRIGMTLTDTLAPEGIILSFRQNTVCI